MAFRTLISLSPITIGFRYYSDPGDTDNYRYSMLMFPVLIVRSGLPIIIGRCVDNEGRFF